MAETTKPTQTALEQEINRWNGFAYALRRYDREVFEELMKRGRTHALEINNANRKTTFEPMVMSIIIDLNEQLRKIQEELNQMYPPPKLSSDEKKTDSISSKPVAVYFKKKKPGGEQTRLG